MSNQMIYLPDSFQMPDEKIVFKSSAFFATNNKLADITENGVIVCSYIKDNRLLKEMSFIPDILFPRLGLVKHTFIHTPFNYFQQCGAYSIVGLYQDGRLRFWDLITGKCYLVTPLCDIKYPESITHMDAILDCRKRFLYFVSKLKSRLE